VQVAEAGVLGHPVPGAGFVRDKVPAQVGVAAGQRVSQHLRERFGGLERGQEQRADQVEVGLQREPGLRFERVESDRRRVRRAGPHDGDRAGAEPTGHAGVLGFGRFDDQPRHPGGMQAGEEVADGVGLAGAGRAGDEGMPVEGVSADPQRSDRKVGVVEDVAEDDLAVVFRGQVEDGWFDQADPGQLPPRWAGQFGDELGGGQERRTRPVNWGRGVRRYGAGAPGVAERAEGWSGDQHVGQLVEVAGAAQQGCRPPCRCRVGAADQNVDVPQPASAGGGQLAVPSLRAGQRDPVEFGVLPLPQPGNPHRQRLQFALDGRVRCGLGDDQPGECSWQVSGVVVEPAPPRPLTVPSRL
jgi:hypothetical protein